MSDKPYIRRVHDAGISLGEPHDSLTDLCNDALQNLREGPLSSQLAGMDMVLILVDPHTERQAIGTEVANSVSYADTMATIVVALSSGLGRICQLVPQMIPLVRARVLEWAGD